MLDVAYVVDVTHGVIFPLLGQVDELTDRFSVDGVSMRGSVEISGTTQMTVSVDCSEVLARRLGAAMFDVDEEALSIEDVVDALGEVANIIGGNIKALLPGPSELGLPTVHHRKALHPLDAVVEQAFDCMGEPLRVCLAKPTTG